MKIAVWRLGAQLQTHQESRVGGGKITHWLLEELVRQGHEVVLVGGGDSQLEIARRYSLENAPTAQGCGACLILTGPFNAMYQALYETYQRLAGFEGRVVYAQWDTALPFYFAPERVKLFGQRCGVTSQDLRRNKVWKVATQLGGLAESPKGTAGQEFGAQVVRCFWEAIEADGEPLAPHPCPIPTVGYFGSDRPGRVGELARWFAAPNSPALTLHGRWAEDSLRRIRGRNQRFEYRGPVAEGVVRERLNEFAWTLHTTDTAYVREDFIAQRFIENAMAGVATVYSDRIQPSVEALVPRGHIVRGVEDLNAWLELNASQKRRVALVERQQETILGWARNHVAHPRVALEEMFR